MTIWLPEWTNLRSLLTKKRCFHRFRFKKNIYIITLTNPHVQTAFVSSISVVSHQNLPRIWVGAIFLSEVGDCTQNRDKFG